MQAFFWCRLEVSTEVLGLDPDLLKQHRLEAKLYRDAPDFTNAQPVVHGTLDLTITKTSTADRMNGSNADWHQATAQVLAAFAPSASTSC